MLQFSTHFVLLNHASTGWKAWWIMPVHNFRILVSLDGQFWQPGAGFLKDDDGNPTLLPLDGLGADSFRQPGDLFIHQDDFG
ncbi:hypothetical protein MA16_Dca013801 [Dendrobium catenatum]|uniref:Uncharacterized protein n=1 Tax=Dendrobium catenatum TaxID=906689 RepID=A0A2I0W8F0_9ASPA|nr:hypothetical protein MA16_Dca013801 [Dendrobium catenatum]